MSATNVPSAVYMTARFACFERYHLFCNNCDRHTEGIHCKGQLFCRTQVYVDFQLCCIRFYHTVEKCKMLLTSDQDPMLLAPWPFGENRLAAQVAIVYSSEGF